MGPAASPFTRRQSARGAEGPAAYPQGSCTDGGGSMPLMVVKLPRDERKSWALAVAVSVLFHTAVFAVLPKRASYFSPKKLDQSPSSAMRAEESGPPIILSMATEPEVAEVPARMTDAQPRQPTADASESP